MPTSYEKLSTLLKELFQLDQADLDFGIYRIMNQKRGEITRFLETELLPQVKAAFDQYRPADKKVIEAEIQKAVQGAEALGVDPNAVPKVKELREQLANYSVDTTALENEVYSHLYSFFRRYYDNGDFISMRRYKEGVYAIPYEGEEVKLHWANADQYYVKTTENFRDYTFRLPSGRLAHFKIVDAETEKDNVKAENEKERRFMLAAETPIAVEGDALILRFEYHADPEKRDQKTLNTLASETILAGAPAEWAADLKTLSPTESNPKRNLLEKHLVDYTARNTFDYFIHKDLSGFLCRELDFYIKNEVMHLDDIEDEGAPRVEQYLSKIKVIRAIAHKIIAFLAQIEDFQKKLWLKKKFVVETNYCITLDRVPEALYPEICANDVQREEWVRLFAIDEITGVQPAQPELGTTPKPGYSVPMTVEFLKANPFLVLDTKLFDRQFIDALLASIENIDEKMDGVLIHSENFQALELLQKKYRDKIDFIYIDPPYNREGTDSEILYKNNYQNSSWLSLLQDRLVLGKHLLRNDSPITIAIDDYELSNLGKLMELVFYDYDIQRVIVNHYPGSGSGRGNISRTHEYSIFAIPNGLDILRGSKKESGERERGFRRSGTGENNYRVGRPNSFFAVLVDPNTYEIKGIESPPEIDNQNYPRDNSTNGYCRIYPIGEDGSERVWSLSYERTLDEYKNGNLYCTSNFVIKRLYDDDETRENLISLWDGTKFNASANGTNLLTNILGSSGIFGYPKSVFTVTTAIDASVPYKKNAVILDYFAGSGTTAHAVIYLNRDDDGIRKYVLIEMGTYFDTATKPRIQKVIYSKDWKDGNPISREGSSHCFRYLRLESYEDALNNLTFKRSTEQQLALEANPEFKENYTLSYMLDVESKGSLLNLQSFIHPFDYTLNIATGTVGEIKPTKVDLPETFNYLIGLHIETMQSIRGFRVVTGKNPSGERTLIIWRDLEEKANADLEEFFRKQDYNPRDMEFDLIYVNGDNNLENIRRPDETWKVRLIEEEFLRLMFDAESN